MRNKPFRRINAITHWQEFYPIPLFCTITWYNRRTFTPFLLSKRYVVRTSKVLYTQFLYEIPLYVRGKTLAVRGLEEHVWITLIFENHQFHVIYCVTLAFFVLFLKNFWFTIHIVDSWFWRIIDQTYWACGIFRWLPNLQVCRDELIRVELGNLFGSSR